MGHVHFPAHRVYSTASARDAGPDIVDWQHNGERYVKVRLRCFFLKLTIRCEIGKERLGTVSDRFRTAIHAIMKDGICLRVVMN